MKINQLSELRAMNALVGLYVSYELDIPTKQQVEEIYKVDKDWKNNAQTIIAKSFVASMTYKIVMDNPDLEQHEIVELIVEDINKNLITLTKMGIDLENF